MAMTASSRAPQGAGTPESERSPFARLTELLAPYQPAKPLITLSLGEPQHPVPAFVGPVLAKHIADFGRYPIAKGIEPFRRAAANWLSTRFDLPRRDRSRDRASGAERQPRGPVFRGAHRRPLCRRAQGQAGDPDAQSVLSRPMPPAPAPRAASRFICRPRSPTDFYPTSMRSTTPRWRERSRSTSPRRPIRKARWPRATISAA